MLSYRVQCISCSKACHCSETCTNRPFRKEKKIKIVKVRNFICGLHQLCPPQVCITRAENTVILVCCICSLTFFFSRNFSAIISLKDYLPFQTEFCGWGVEAAEPISKGEFIIEYIGEGSVLDWTLAYMFIYIEAFFRITLPCLIFCFLFWGFWRPGCELYRLRSLFYSSSFRCFRKHLLTVVFLYQLLMMRCAKKGCGTWNIEEWRTFTCVKFEKILQLMLLSRGIHLAF